MAACVGQHGATRPIVPILVRSGGIQRSTYALIDSGANVAAITDKLADELNTTRHLVHVSLNTFDNNDKTERSITSFKVSNLNNTFELNIERALIANTLSTENEIPPNPNDLKKFEHLKNLKINTLENNSIGVLLDAKYAYYFFTGHNHVGPPNQPMALGTHFGPAIIGPKITSQSVNNRHMLNEDTEEIFCINVKKFAVIDLINRAFRMDFIQRDFELYPQEFIHRSANDKKSLKQMEESIHFNEEEGRWQITMPWILGRQPTADLFRTIDFYKMTMNRHARLKRKFELNPELRKGSFVQMNMTLEEGHARIIPNLDAPKEAVVCYLPNHIVTKPDKPGKFRICQDASARVGKHYLNKYLFCGPDLLNNLITIILGFRKEKYTISADISNFFYMILLEEYDRPSLRYPWWSDESMKHIIMIESCRHMFGITSSPNISNFVLRAHAEREKNNISEETYLTLLHNFYVDDLLKSLKKKETAHLIKKEITEALARGGFNICKWRSNIPEINDPPKNPIPLPQTNETSTTNPPTTPIEHAKTSPDAEAKSTIVVNNNNSTPPTANVNLNTLENLSHEEESDSDDEPDKEITTAELVSILNNNWESECAKDLVSESDLTDKILGVGYCFIRDVMNIRIGNKSEREIVTKKDLLSFVASIYDPIGLVAPWVLEGKRIFQIVSSPTIPYKSALTKDIQIAANKWKSSINYLKGLTISRWTNPLGLEDCLTDLAIFCDSSKDGFGIVGYFRKYLKGGGDKISTSFIIGKSHVVPANMTLNPTDGALPHGDSIPKLELCAAKIAAQWRDILVRTSGETFENIYHFTDSVCVLNWLFDFDRRFKTFENFRIESIRALSLLSEWRHVPSKLNPADLSSKGIKGNESKKWRFYHQGPPFLSLPISEWPPKLPVNTTTKATLNADIGALSILAVHGTTDEVNIIAEPKTMESWITKSTCKLEHWRNKIRRVAIIKKVILKLRDLTKAKNSVLMTNRLRPRNNPEQTKPNRKYVIHLSQDERESAEILLIKALQSDSFQKETMHLVKLGIFSPNALKELNIKDSKLSSLSPFIDENGLIRAGGRCEKAEYLPYNHKYPIILPNHQNETVRAIIRHYHQSHYNRYHCTALQTYSLLREKFFVLGGKVAVKSVISKCITCQRLNKRLGKQREGDLPTERIEVIPPFYNTGIDALGPFHLKHKGRGTIKLFVLLACCMSTRAITLIPLRDMTSSSLINALIKIFSQFPSLKKLYSDNGSNLIGADNEIKNAIYEWNQTNLKKELEIIGIEWHFGPAYCGQAGGAWERLIGLAKKLLRSVVGTRNIDYDDFESLLYGASYMMNRRPITTASTDIDDTHVLTPAHFLYPYLYVDTTRHIVPPQTESYDCLRHGWRSTQFLLDEFWRIFKSTYVESLRRRKKVKSTNITLGQLVLIESTDSSREYWPCGRIIEILNVDVHHPRRFKIRLSSGKIVDRHISSIVVLET